MPVRQWVLSLPHRVRWACAFDHRTTQGVRRIFVRALASFHGRDASAHGIANTKAGAVVAIQRFDSALRLNVHFHSLWPDGTFTCAPRQPEATFHPARQITDEDVERLVRQIRSRVLRYLRKTGKLADPDAAELDPHDASLFDTLRAASSLAGPRSALAPATAIRGSARARQRLPTSRAASSAPTSTASPCTLPSASMAAAANGSSACALRTSPTHRARAPVADQRRQGAVQVQTPLAHVVLDPLTLIERLIALIPAPRKKQ